jgi:heptosyltransferase III
LIPPALPEKPVIIISRSDNIGDVVLTLPIATFIKEKYPASTILFLGRNSINTLVESCANIDSFIDWDVLAAIPMPERVAYFRQLKADVILHIFPRLAIARLARKAKIPWRIGTSHRFYHLINCNILVDFTRKYSELHEAQLNFKLLQRLNITVPTLDTLKTSYGLTRIPEWEGEDILDVNKFNLVLHPKSRGSAREWSWEHWNKLVTLLQPEKFKIFVTGTAQEENEIRKNLLDIHPEITSLAGKLNLAQLIAFISKADGIIACSTGPLHIAAALGKRAIGIFPPIKPMHPGRWAPVGVKSSYLVIDKNCNDCRKSGNCTCINLIKPKEVLQKLTDNS